MNLLLSNFSLDDDESDAVMVHVTATAVKTEGASPETSAALGI